MNLSDFFKSIIDMDYSPIVICNLENNIIYMNPSAQKRYAKKGGSALVGKSIFECHQHISNIKIVETVEWFKINKNNNQIYMLYHSKDNADIYMVALRNDNGELIGYYEKHECRTREIKNPYDYK